MTTAPSIEGAALSLAKDLGRSIGTLPMSPVGTLPMSPVGTLPIIPASDEFLSLDVEDRHLVLCAQRDAEDRGRQVFAGPVLP